MKKHQHYINGQYVQSTSNETIEIINPSTEEVISTIPDGTEEDANKAVEAAHNALKEWEKKPAIDRGRIVRKLGDKLAERREDFIRLLLEEQAKSYEQAVGEVDTAIDYFHYMSEWARRLEGEIVPSDRSNEHIMIFKKPIGVVAGIVPWNFPVFILARKVATALVTGCTLVLKPSKQTPNTMMEFAKVIDEVDIPAGVVNIVLGTGSKIGNVLASHPKVRMISMTGSVGAGEKVMEAAAKSMAKVNLELGGKAPAIVTENADIDLAVKHIKTSRITNAGQACNNAERVYVHESIAEEFIQKLVHAFKDTKLGNPAEDHQADMGPLISEDRLKTVHEMVEKAVSQGAKIETGGQRASIEKGYFYEPTILTNVRQDMEIIQEEIFGPVLPIMTYRTLDEAIEMSNDSDYGLSSSVYTENIHEAMQVIDGLKYGETYVNRENFEAIQGYHAGLRKSGLGGADGKHGVEDFLVTHAVYLEYKGLK
ncbi:aldehyde dehydrogenase [Falsibacillus pallidus]|uniref:3-sulfolactaldehyde dehydrogenase n=1 Tax=Falsibacillus pallidus TaxID=493781 RepID=A0A370GQ06_9BACI|nr:aldehyde dehydrogenase [Falsibacillus pallidus]RDI45808.1 lactaldehyde dehydrogenase [Falsibacillus pallidus]